MYNANIVVLLRLQWRVFYIIIIIAERSEANNRDLWASESQLAFIYNIYIYIYIYLSVRHAFPASGGQATCSKWRLRQLHYMDAVFEFLAQKEAEIWTSLLRHFIK